MLDCWSSDFGRCLIKGCSVFLCLLVSVSVSMSPHQCALYAVRMTSECADMPAHSTLNASMTFSYCSLSCMCMQPKHTVADKLLNCLSSVICKNNSVVVLICWLSAHLKFWIVSLQPLFIFLCVYIWINAMTPSHSHFSFPLSWLEACLDMTLSLVAINRTRKLNPFKF